MWISTMSRVKEQNPQIKTNMNTAERAHQRLENKLIKSSATPCEKRPLTTTNDVIKLNMQLRECAHQLKSIGENYKSAGHRSKYKDVVIIKKDLRACRCKLIEFSRSHGSNAEYYNIAES